MTMVRRSLGLVAVASLLACVGCSSVAGAKFKLFVNRNNQEIVTDDKFAFVAGDQFRLRFTPLRAGYFYIVEKGSSGNYAMLFPRPELAGGESWMARWQWGREVFVPSKGWFVIDKQPGVETLYVCSAKRPILPLERLMTMQTATTKDFEDALQQTRETQPSDSISSKAYEMGWVILKSTSDLGRAVLVGDVMLRHE
jgi:hypothetical protein